MDKVYLSYCIRALPYLNVATDCWVPKAEVLWKDNGKTCQHTLTGPDDCFKTIDEALIHAIESAQAWINDQSPLSVLNNTRQLSQKLT